MKLLVWALIQSDGVLIRRHVGTQSPVCGMSLWKPEEAHPGLLLDSATEADTCLSNESGSCSYTDHPPLCGAPSLHPCFLCSSLGRGESAGSQAAPREQIPGALDNLPSPVPSIPLPSKALSGELNNSTDSLLNTGFQLRVIISYMPVLQ